MSFSGFKNAEPMPELQPRIKVFQDIPIEVTVTGNDIHNGPYMAGLVRAATKSIVSLFVLPCTPEQGKTEEVTFDFGASLAAGHLPQSGSELIADRPEFDTKHYMLCLLMTDPAMPIKANLLVGAARWCHFDRVGSKAAGMEGMLLLSTMAELCPEKMVYILAADDYWERYKEISEKLAFFVRHEMGWALIEQAGHQRTKELTYDF